MFSGIQLYLLLKLIMTPARIFPNSSSHTLWLEYYIYFAVCFVHISLIISRVHIVFICIISISMTRENVNSIKISKRVTRLPSPDVFCGIKISFERWILQDNYLWLYVLDFSLSFLNFFLFQLAVYYINPSSHKVIWESKWLSTWRL